MPRRAEPAIRLAASIVLLGGVAIASCAEVLGISDPFPDVAAELCKCELEPSLDTRWPGQTCSEHVSAALAADPEAAQRWLELFQAEGCQSCGAAETCASAEPLCAAQGEPCSRSQGCCGYDPDNPSLAYCGPTDPSEGIDGMCVSDPPTCVGAFAECNEGADCCGFTGNLGQCVMGDGKPTGLCLLGCAPGYDDLCPGCCATLITSTDSFSVCADGIGVKCSLLCATNADCDEGMSCKPVSTTMDESVRVRACVAD